jgi:hypothetical protein
MSNGRWQITDVKKHAQAKNAQAKRMLDEEQRFVDQVTAKWKPKPKPAPKPKRKRKLAVRSKGGFKHAGANAGRSA